MSRGKTAIIALITALATFGIDRLSKWLVVDVMDLRNLLYIELGPILSFVMAWNEGVNFGLFASGSDAMRWVLVGFAIIVSIAVLIWAVRVGRGLFAAAAGLVAGGALGNAWDRVVEGAVADFLNISCCSFHNPYAFNIADVAIFAGAIAMALLGTGKQKAVSSEPG